MLYKDGIKDIDKYEMNRLWQIPEVKEMLTDEIMRILNGEAGKAFEQLQLDRLKWFRELYETPAKSAEKESIYWFELTRFKDSAWRIIDIVPYPPQGTQPYYIVTPELMEEMADYPVKPGEIFSMKKDLSNGETIHLKFIRHATASIMGTISFLPPSKGAAKGNTKAKMSNMAEKVKDDVNKYLNSHNEEMEFRIFHRFMFGNLEGGKQFVRDFLLQRLPEVLNNNQDPEEKNNEEPV